MPGMGFRHVEDPRDQNFPMRLMLDPLRAEHFPKGLPPGTRHYRTGKGMSQGDTGTCTAFCSTHKIHAAPIMQQLPVSDKTGQTMTPFELYRLIVSIDEYDDNDAEATEPDDDKLQMGSSVRAAAKALVKIGVGKSFVHAGSIEDIRAWHLAGFGGIMNGTDWYTGMMDTDSEGFVSVTGQIEGGHAYASCGWNDFVKHNGRMVPAKLCQQSWPLPWGLNGTGFFWIEQEAEAKLFPSAEYIALTEKRLKPVHTDAPKSVWDYLRPSKPANPEPY